MDDWDFQAYIGLSETAAAIIIWLAH